LKAGLATVAAVLCFAAPAVGQRVFNVREYGATGRKSDNARHAIQEAIDACGKVGGGRVYLPPGEYTSGQLHLRSGVRLYLEAGATLFASLDGSQYDDAKKAALIYGEDVHDIALEGGGTLDGQASYEWRPNDITDHYILPNQRQMEAAGKPLMRSFPTSFGKETVYPRMVLLIRATDVSIAGLRFLHLLRAEGSRVGRRHRSGWLPGRAYRQLHDRNRRRRDLLLLHPDLGPGPAH